MNKTYYYIESKDLDTKKWGWEEESNNEPTLKSAQKYLKQIITNTPSVYYANKNNYRIIKVSESIVK